MRTKWVTVLPVYDNGLTKKAVMLLRKKNPHKGRLNGVGGKLVPGEDAREAAVRESTEELGLPEGSIHPDQLEYALSKLEGRLALYFLFLNTYQEGAVRLGDMEEGHLRFVPLYGLESRPDEEFAPYVREMLRSYGVARKVPAKMTL